MAEEWAYRAKNTSTGQVCEHCHHSKQSATRCAEYEGWTKFKIIRVTRQNYEKYAPKKVVRKARLMEQELDSQYKITRSVVPIHPMNITIEPTDDGYYANCEEGARFNFGKGDTVQGAIEDLMAVYAGLYEEYVLCDISKLSDDAIELRGWLMDTFKEV